MFSIKPIKRFYALLLTAVFTAVMLTACSDKVQDTAQPSAAPEPGLDEPPVEIWPGATFDLDLDGTQKAPTARTIEINDSVYALLDFTDEQEFEFATRGLLAAPDALEITNEDGRVIWSQQAFCFVDDKDAPGTVNPSLWRHTQLNHIYGLFEVTDGIYQVRGYDMSNLTLIRGDTGWIVFDPLISVECAEAALKLVNETLGERPVVAVIYSHPHVDHFGGVRGIISEEDAAAGVPVIAPEHFHEHAVSENLFAGTAMGRRSGYQYGAMLEPGEQGCLAMGIGMGQSKGTTSYIKPTDTITYTGEIRVIDGVTMEFQMTPGTEAPAEMNTWFPGFNALWMAENCNGTLHNLYTLRGAQIRDGNAWASYIMEALTLYGDKAEVIFQSHNWPRWGNDVINEYMINTAAIYKFINDQTLLYINQGYTSSEIAHMIQLPEDLEKLWYTRQYYGTLEHNARAVYQKYMGWYDANPVNLHPLPPSESAVKFVEYLGDTDAVLEMAYRDFENGEYQWVAQITNILVFADPANTAARYLCADALEQLGYQAESGPWRNAYLSGAMELRQGMSADQTTGTTGTGDVQRNLEPHMVFDYMGIQIDASAAQDLNLKINVNVTGDDTYLITIRAGVLLWQKGTSSSDADATVTVPKPAIALLLAPDSDINGLIEIEGDADILTTLSGYMASFDRYFNIVEP